MNYFKLTRGGNDRFVFFRNSQIGVAWEQVNRLRAPRDVISMWSLPSTPGPWDIEAGLVGVGPSVAEARARTVAATAARRAAKSSAVYADETRCIDELAAVTAAVLRRRPANALDR